MNELLKLKQGYLKEIECLQSKIKEIDNKISKNGDIPTQEDLKIAEERKVKEEQERKIRDENRKREKEDFLRNMFRKYEENKTNNEKIKFNKEESINFLKSYEINNAKEWKKWILKNHPDKNPNGDSILCAKIISAGRNLDW